METVGIQADGFDAQLRVGKRLWAIGDVTGLWPLTHFGKYQGDVVVARILGERQEAHYEAVTRVVLTEPHAAAGRRGAKPASARPPPCPRCPRRPPTRAPTPNRTASSPSVATANG